MAPLYFTSLNPFGIRAFNISSGQEAPTEGPADVSALADVMSRVRATATRTDEPGSQYP